jgi:uncharacterized protein (DUF1778 family)
MAAEKLSVSMDQDLVRLIRDAAAGEGMSLSTWLADAARAKARQQALREALAAYAKEHGEMTTEDAMRVVAASRKKSILIAPRTRRR